MAVAQTFAIALLLGLPSAPLAQVKVLTSGGFFGVLQDLGPQFEKSTGVALAIQRGSSQGNGPNTIRAQLSRGVAADVVILSREGLDDLITAQQIVKGTDKDLVRTPLGVAVRTGASLPDVSTVEAFKQTLLHAKSITFPGSTTGIYMKTKMFPQLGIADEISGKITDVGVAAVARGEAEIAIQPESELLGVPGVQFIGPIPSPIQYISVFSAAIVTNSKQQDLSKKLIAFLVSDSATTAMTKHGMERVQPR
jgi:molybdate transport system substrate-binding protein